MLGRREGGSDREEGKANFHLPMSELQKASWGWIGTQVHASTTRSLRRQLQSSAKRLSTHPDMLMLPPRLVPHFRLSPLARRAKAGGSPGNGGGRCSCSLRAATETFPPAAAWAFFCPLLLQARSLSVLHELEAPRAPLASRLRAAAGSYSLDRAPLGLSGSRPPDQSEPRITSSLPQEKGERPPQTRWRWGRSEGFSAI